MDAFFDSLINRGKQSKRIYLDNVASTQLDRRVYDAMRPYWSEVYGNPGGIHKEGVGARKALDKARHIIASCLSAHDDEVIFTGNGTEANNLAILGLVERLETEGIKLSDMHFISSSIEHPSVLDCFKSLEKKGAQVTYVDVDEAGIVNPKGVAEALNEKTVLVSIMAVNNEIGTIMPIREISKQIKSFCKRRKDNTGPLYFHTDASQAALLLPLNILRLGVDLLTLDAQKIYGPKGSGALFKKRDVHIESIMMGGSQEFGLRPGTENVPLAVGFAEAFSIAVDEREKENRRLKKLQTYFFYYLRNCMFFHVL